MILEGVAGIPEDLLVDHFRSGHGKFQVEGKKISHQLDADGVMLGVTFNGDGQVAIRHRLVQTQGLLRDKYYKRVVQNGAFGTRADAAPWDKMAGTLKNTANSGALWFENKLLALWPYGKPFLIDPGCLGTILASEESGASDLGGVLRDEETGFAV